MTFISRPFLSNDQFRQSTDSILTLSGQTNIAATTGFTLTDGIGNDIIVTASGASAIGHVMTYDGSKITLAPPTAISDNQFLCGMTDITRVPYVGLNMNSNTINSFLEKFFFPPILPSSTLSFDTTSINKEFGNNLDLINQTNVLNWSVIENTNTISEIVLNTGGTSYNYSITPTGGTQSGSVYYDYDPNTVFPPTPTISSSVTYGVSGKTISGETTQTTLSSYWKGKRYWGAGYNNYINTDDSTINDNLIYQFDIDSNKSELTTTGSKCFCNYNNGTTSQYFYYSYPKLFGCPTQIIVNGMPNNSWGSENNGTFDEYTRINSYGYEQPYYLIRSDNMVTGNWNINITTAI